MIDELRRRLSSNQFYLQQIDQFERNYYSNDAIKWYTMDSCFFRLINQALRDENIDLLKKYRFYIYDLYQKLDELHQQMKIHDQVMLSLYRGQTLSTNQIDEFIQHIGGIVSCNSFLSTTASLDIALLFAGGSVDEGTVSNRPVIFCIEVDSSIRNTRPYAKVTSFSTMEEEDEYLFAVGSVFRIKKVDNLSGSEHIPVIYLQLIDENDLPAESTPLDIAKLIPESKLLSKKKKKHQKLKMK